MNRRLYGPIYWYIYMERVKDEVEDEENISVRVIDSNISIV